MAQVKEETLKGAKWLLLQKFTMQPIQIFYGIILSYLITPQESGILGLTGIFFAIAATLSSAGFSQGLVRKVDRTEVDINTVFWFNLAANAFFATLLFIAAPWITLLFPKYPELTLLTRISAILMLISSSSSVHWTLYHCRRDFKTPAIVQTITALIGMPITIYLAYTGWSFWSITISGIVTSLLSLIIVWRISSWKPRFEFSKSSFKEFFSFGSRLAASSLLDTTFAHLTTFIIGKFYSPASLALYSRGSSLAMMPVSTINGMLLHLTYPILSAIQSDEARLIEVYKKYIKISSLAIFWCILTLSALAQPFVDLLYGTEWSDCAIFLSIAGLHLCFYHIHAINLNILQVKGRSDLFLRLEIIKKAIALVALCITAPISVEAMCWSYVIISFICLFLNTYYTGKLFNYGITKQWEDFLPYYALAALAAIPGFVLTFTPLPHYVQLLLGGSLSFAIYFTLLHRKKDTALHELIKVLEEKGVLAKLQRINPLKKK